MNVISHTNISTSVRDIPLLDQDHSKTFESLTVQTMSVQFVNNTYSDISMGVTRLRDNDTFVRGSLHKAYNVMAIDFSGEKYYNIMGHTSEHLQQVIM